jgi:hypothetical protein
VWAGAVDLSGQVNIGNNGNATDDYVISGVTFTNTLHVGNEVSLFGVNPTGGHLRQFTNNVLTDGILNISASGYTVTGNLTKYQVFEDAAQTNTITGNFIMQPCSTIPNGALGGATTMTVGLSVISGNYFYACSGNPHMLSMADTGTTVTSNIFETDYSLPDDTGDMVVPNTGTIVTNNLTIASGTLTSELMSSGVSVTGVIVKNNTIIAGVQMACGHIGEPSTSFANMYAVYRNMLCVHKQNYLGYQMQDVSGTTHATQAVTSMDYNAGWNVVTGMSTYHLIGGGDMPVTSTAYGVHDIIADPWFVDGNRSLGSWGATLGCDGTGACALAELAKINDATGYNSAYNIAALLAFVKPGYYPTNPALRAAGSPTDGSPDLGAFAVVAANPTLTKSVNPGGTGYRVTFPGHYAVEIGSGDGPVGSPDPTLGQYKGIARLWDLKSDSTQQYSVCGLDTGCIWDKWDWTNHDTTDRYSGGGSTGPSPGTLTVLEDNNLRKRIKYHFVPIRFGTNTAVTDCCISVDQYFSMEAPDKIYRTTKFSYTGTDGQAPLVWGFPGGVGVEPILNGTWAFAGNLETIANNWSGGPNPCSGTSNFLPPSPSPWLWMWQDPPPNNVSNKTFLLYSSAGTSSFPASNDCISAGNPGLPTVGDVSHCAALNCIGGVVDYHVAMKTNMLLLAGPADTYVYPFGSTPQYFKGIRTEWDMNLPAPLSVGVDVYSHYLSMRVGDNGITSIATAQEQATEYHDIVAPTMTTGTVGTGADVTNGFDLLKGAYVMTATSGVSFTTHNIQHYPVFQVASWTAAVPGTITVGGVSKTLGTDYTATKLDSSTLLLQSLSASVADSTAWNIAQSGTCEATGGGVCYYVDTHSGAGTGTFAAPFGLPDLVNPSDYVPGAACQILHPGDILYFRAGTYPTLSTIAGGGGVNSYIAPVRDGGVGNRITMKPYPGESVTIAYAGTSTKELAPPLIGTLFSHILITGFILDASSTNAVSAEVTVSRLGAVGGSTTDVEFSYNKLIGGTITPPLTGDTDPNYQGVIVEAATNINVHHNEISGFNSTSGTNRLNATGIKVYSTTTSTFSDNWVHDNGQGIYDKSSSSFGSGNTYSRNWITANQIFQWSGTNQLNSVPFSAPPQVAFLNSNVIDGFIAPICCGTGGVLSDSTEIHNNLFRFNSGTSALMSWGGAANQVINLKVWNNIWVNSSTNCIMLSNDQQAFTGQPSAIFNLSDYNASTCAPSWLFSTGVTPQTFTMVGSTNSMQANALETHSFQSISTSSIFVDTVNYVVKSPYSINGRFGDTMGPLGIATATILNTSRYGPQLGFVGLSFLQGNFSGITQ